jgi:hypothetical protein
LNSPGQRKFGANTSIEKLVLRINPAEADKPAPATDSGDTAISANKMKRTSIIRSVMFLFFNQLLREKLAEC